MSRTLGLQIDSNGWKKNGHARAPSIILSTCIAKWWSRRRASIPHCFDYRHTFTSKFLCQGWKNLVLPMIWKFVFVQTFKKVCYLWLCIWFFPCHLFFFWQYWEAAPFSFFVCILFRLRTRIARQLISIFPLSFCLGNGTSRKGSWGTNMRIRRGYRCHTCVSFIFLF